MKRKSSAFLALCLIIISLLLTSCSGSDSVSKTADATAEEKETAVTTVEATEAPTEAVDNKKLYLDFLTGTDISYDSGSLIWLDNDDVPELYLGTIASAQPAYVCFISDGEVHAFETYSTAEFSYELMGGAFTTGAMRQGYTSWMIYLFDGKEVTEEYSGSCYQDQYAINEESVSKEDYDSLLSNYNFNAYPKSVSKDELADRINDSFDNTEVWIRK